jgi:hypothetical protein
MKLVLNINGKEITVSIDEAKMLHQELSKLFDSKLYPEPLVKLYPEPLVRWPTGLPVTCNTSD